MKKAIGRWRIISMEMWDNDFLDAEAPAHITIHKNMQGDFQFGYVQGEIDGRALIVDFTWSGFDENDPANGRGWLESQKIPGPDAFIFTWVMNPISR